MELKTEKLADDISEVVIDGRLDASNAQSVEKQIQELIGSGQTRIIFNLSELVYISSAGLRVLITTIKLLKVKQGNLVLFGLKENIEEILKVSGFTRLFNIQQNKEDAIAQF